MTDMVNHPPHYTAYKGLEIIQLTEQMDFLRGNAVKYVARAGLKGDEAQEIEDLKKAVWYIERAIKKLEDVGTANPTPAETPRPGPVSRSEPLSTMSASKHPYGYFEDAEETIFVHTPRPDRWYKRTGYRWVETDSPVSPLRWIGDTWHDVTAR